ncbi:MAG: hypothetical protein RL274_528 [Pseudomonadota bacterium]
MVGLSNLFLLRAATDYFLLDTAQQNPFLHTWSLGIEEQYYILFAIVILAVPAKLTERIHGYRIVLLGLIVAASAAYAFAADLTSLQRFYLPFTQVWEIGIGSLLAIAGVGTAKVVLIQDARLRSALRLAALSVILAAALFPVAGEVFHPGPVLAGIIASIALIAILSGAAPRLEPLLAAPALYTGRISYGLYLWHWILLFALDLTVGKNTPLGVVMALLLSFALSAISFRYFESPLRNPRNFGNGKLLAAVGAGFVLVVTVLVTFYKHPNLVWSGTPRPRTQEWMPDFNQAFLSDGRVNAATCHWCGERSCRTPPKEWSKGFPPDRIPPICHGPGAQTMPRILSLGDSQANADWGMLVYTSQQGYGWSTFSKDGCALPGPGIKSDDECKLYWRKIPDYVRSELKADDIIYISTDWNAYADPSATRPVLEPLMVLARSLGIQVVIKGPLPVFQRPAYLCTAEWFRFDYSRCKAGRSDERARTSKVSVYLDGLAKQPGVSIFRPFDLVCPGPVCSQFRNGHPLFRDRTHLAFWGSSRLGPPFVGLLQTLQGKAN